MRSGAEAGRSNIWQWLRWLFLFAVLPLALLIGVFVLYLSANLMQFFYFGLLDITGRSAPRQVASFANISLALTSALAVSVVIVGLVLAAISSGFRRHAQTAAAIAFGVFLAANLGVVIYVLARSQSERKLARASAVWTTNLVGVPPDLNTFAATRVMVFPDETHLVIASGGELSALDTRTGKIVASANIGRQPLIFASSNGNVVVSAGGQIQLFSAQLKPLSISFDVTGGEANRVSPSGARIGWQRFSKDPPKTIFLETESLKRRETFASCNIEAMSDHVVAESVLLVNENSTPAINVCEPGNSTYVFYRGPFQPFSYFYLNNEIMLILSGGHLKVVNQRGEVLGEDDWPGVEVNFAGVSRDGARFAIATERWGFGDPAYINKESVVVYETSSVRPVMTIESEHPPSLQSASALSPNGNAIAIGAGSGISYFRVP